MTSDVAVDMPWAVRTATTPTKSDPRLRAFLRNSPYLLEAKSALRALRKSAHLSVARLRALLLMESLSEAIRCISEYLSHMGSEAMSGWGWMGW